MPEEQVPDRVQALVTAHAVLHTVSHILTVSIDLDDARRQVAQLLELVNQKTQEERIPNAMLREGGRDALMDLL